MGRGNSKYVISQINMHIQYTYRMYRSVQKNQQSRP